MRGAAMVEFVIAIVPVLMVFFAWVQLGQLYTAHLLMKHAALVAARAGTVMIEPDHNPGATGGEADVQAAANAAIGPMSRKLQLTTSITGSGSYSGLVTAKVSGKFTCSVPLGRNLVCGGGVKDMPEFQVQLPLQGANYK